MKRVGFSLVVGIVCLASTSYATLDALDLSNLDLANFRFFRNLPSQNPATAPYADPILEVFQKKKAVIEYFERLLLGNSLYGPPIMIEFNPHYGKAWQPHFERHYGKRAERLIELLGSGASPEVLKYHGAIPKEYGSYH